ncbi:hypothetical protein Q5752_002102 [Cryptotrichosporon argae]
MNVGRFKSTGDDDASLLGTASTRDAGAHAKPSQPPSEMGFLKRLRSSSTAPQHDAPPPSVRPSLPKSASSLFLSSRRRDELAPSTPSSPAPSAASRSRVPWRRKDDLPPVPVPAVSAAPAVARTRTCQSSGGVDALGLLIPPVALDDGSGTDATLIPHDDSKRHSKESSTSSEIWRRDGGVLGKLEFESLSLVPRPPTADNVTRSPSLQTEIVSLPPISPVAPSFAPEQLRQPLAQPPPSPFRAGPASSSPRQSKQRMSLPPLETFSLTAQVADPPARIALHRDGETVVPDGNQPLVSATSSARQSEEERRGFWKGKGKSRRNSSTNDLQGLRSSSPAPTKRALPAAPTAKPQALRRPSSSLFHNPFHRSVSRLSIRELDVQPSVDDGSFQLRGFRHVSGVSESETMPHLSQTQPRTAPDAHVPSPSSIKSSPPGHSRQPSEAQETLAASARPRMSRPPSVAASFTSTDEAYTASRVSVAAFRKGIRRQSESLVTQSDIGHGAGAATRDADDDDVSLGIMSRARVRGSAVSFGSYHDAATEDFTKAASATARPSPAAASAPQLAVPVPRRAPSPSPELTFTTRHKRNGGGSGSAGGFIVKSAATTRVEYAKTASQPTANFADVKEPQELVLSPKLQTGYFSPEAPTHTDGVEKPTPMSPSSASMVLTTSTSSARSIAPAPAPIMLPEPQAAADELDLPPPPDAVPDSPTRSPQYLVGESRASLSPILGPLSPSLALANVTGMLDQPLKRFSGLWAQPQAEEGFDPALIALAMTSETSPLVGHLKPPSASTSAKALGPSAMVEPASAPCTVSRGHGQRQSLQLRLASATAALKPPLSASQTSQASVDSLTSAPVVAEPEGIELLDQRADAVRSSESDSTAAVSVRTARVSPSSGRTSTSPLTAKRELPPHDAVPRSSFARAKPRQKSRSWSDSDDDEPSQVGQSSFRSPPRAKAAQPSSQQSPPLASRTSSRRTPVGPRQPALIHATPAPVEAGSSDPPAQREPADDSSDDEPLTQVRAKASRSDFAPSRASRASPSSPSAPRPPSALSRPASALSGTRSASRLSNAAGQDARERRASVTFELDTRPLNDRRQASVLSLADMRRSLGNRLRQIEPEMAPLPARDVVPVARQSYMPARRSRSAQHLQSPRAQSGHPTAAAHSASPASSQSGYVSTPSTSISSVPVPPKGAAEAAAKEMMPPNDPAHDAYQQHLAHQHWQAQYLAAPSRAFDDMWERSSVVSAAPTAPALGDSRGHSHAQHAHAQACAHAHAHAQAQAQMAMMANPYYNPYYGYYPYPYGQLVPRFDHAPGSHSSHGMYSYAPGAQSVYGQSFGPPVHAEPVPLAPPAPARAQSFYAPPVPSSPSGANGLVALAGSGANMPYPELNAGQTPHERASARHEKFAPRPQFAGLLAQYASANGGNAYAGSGTEYGARQRAYAS